MAPGRARRADAAPGAARRGGAFRDALSTLADATASGGALGGVLGALLGWLGPDGTDRGETIATTAGVGTAVGAGLGIAVGSLYLAMDLWGHGSRTEAAPRLRDLGRASRAQLRHQWQVLLDGRRRRLAAGFRGIDDVAPPRPFTGRLRQRSDLAAALEAARSPDGGPRLLVTGSPGYGKTVALLDIAQQLIDEHHNRFGVAVLLSLGSWGHADDDLTKWMVRELCAPSGPLPGADAVATRWVNGGRIAPLLDGLDEIADPASRQRCVAAINDFLHHLPESTALIVASRPTEYTAVAPRGADRLAVNAGIELQELRPALVTRRLREAGPSGERLAKQVRSDPAHPAASLLRVPLWLWIAGRLDAAQTEDLVTAPTAEDGQRILTDAHLTNSIAALAGDARVSVDGPTCRRMLAALAGFLADPRGPDATTFRLENLTPSLPSMTQRRVWGSSFGFACGAFLGLLASDAGWFDVWPGSLMLAIGLGLLGMARPDAGDGAGRPARARIAWSGVRWALAPLAILAAGGVTFGLLARPVFDLPAHHGRTMATSSALLGLMVSAYCAIWLIFTDKVVTRADVPGDELDQGRRASMASLRLHATTVGLGMGGFGVLMGALSGPAPTLVLGLGGTAGGALAGVLYATDRGGWYLFLQWRVRRLAARQGLLPRDVVPFLRAAVDAGILRLAGGGVQFRHSLLADRLRDEAPEPGLMALRQRLGAT